MKTAVLLSLGALALANPVQPVHKVPFTRRNVVANDDGSVNFPKLLKHIQQAARKYNKDYVIPEAFTVPANEKRAGSGTVGLTDQDSSGVDELYYGTGTIGAAKQAFTFDFDTGSSDIFVPGPSCTASKGCAGTRKYNQKGVDEHNTTTITYGSGEVTGENYFDSFTVAGLTATHQNIISLTSASGFSTSDADGLVGLAFQSIANSEQPPFFFTLLSQKKLAAPEFSFYLGRIASGTGNKSELTFGGRDPNHYTGSFTAVPVTSQTYWEVQVAAANVAGAAAANSAYAAAVDSGTTVVIAPSAAAASIYSKIPGAALLPLEGGLTEQIYSYPCSSKPQVSFTLAGKQFVINSLDFSIGTVSSSSAIPILGPLLDALLGGNRDASSQTCIGAIIGADITTPPIYILGDSFLKNWYSSFQYINNSTAYVNLAKSK